MHWTLALAAACAPHVSPPESEPPAATPAATSAYWDQPRAGTNMFSTFPSARRFRAARDQGITLVRLAPDPWQGLERDFLIGDADHYDGLVQGDLDRLRGVLDVADASGLDVVLTMLSLPGARWRQHHFDEDDPRLYRDPAFRAQAVRFWSDLAQALRGHPAIVGYNPLNEPRTDDIGQLRQLYTELLAGIRSVDPSVPVIFDVGRDADPRHFPSFEPFDDHAVLYAFHVYEPWEHTTWRKNRGEVVYGSDAWNRATLEAALAPVAAWQEAHEIAPTRIFGAELGCDRRVPGVEGYFEDLLTLVSERGYHWAYFAFREDSFPGHDHELAPGPIGPAGWEVYGRGRALDLDRPGSPTWDVIQRFLNARRDEAG